MNKRGLGKGLSALIPTLPSKAAIDFDPEKDLLQDIDIKEIIPNSNQPRKNFDSEKLAELAASIKEHGLVQPIIVRPHQDGYEIVAGERRYRACKQLGLTNIPAIIKTLSDIKTTEIALIENIQRQDLNPIEEARAYKKLIEEFGLTQDEIAKKVAKSRPFIANFLRLLQLSDEVIDLVEKGQLSVGHARALLAIADNKLQQQIGSKIIIEELSVRETEKLVKKTLSNLESLKKQKDNKYDDPILNDIQEQLQSKFGTKVLIKDTGKGGKIEIEYYTQNDLTRIIEIITEQGHC